MARPVHPRRSRPPCHGPIQAKPDVTAKYAAQDVPSQQPKHAAYAAMVASVDDTLGTILTALTDLDIRDHTAIFFTSDNGGLAGVTDNRPLRARKGSASAGGVRVPFVVSWPGVTKPGTMTDVPVITPELHTRLDAWIREVGGQFPVPNPDFDPARDRFRAGR